MLHCFLLIVFSPLFSLPGAAAELEGPSHQSALESAIQKIISEGFSREDAITELQRTQGDWQAAIVALSKRTGT